MARRRKTRTRWRSRALLKCSGIAVLACIVTSFLLVLPLRWLDPVTSMFMLRDDSGVTPIRHEWVSWEALGTAAPLAVIGAEDQRFADHAGLDFKAIRKAVDERSARGNLRGASTITQQTVKNLYLWPGRSLLRKGLEAWLAVVAEICLSKQRILEIYLNVAEFGPGIYGVGAASSIYFGKPAAGLGDWEATLLATVLPNPKQLRVSSPSQSMRDRQSWILTQVRRLRREDWLTRID